MIIFLVVAHLVMGFLGTLFINIFADLISEQQKNLIFMLVAGIANLLVVIFFYIKLSSRKIKEIFIEKNNCGSVKHYLAVILLVIGTGNIITKIFEIIDFVPEDLFYEETFFVLSEFKFWIGFLLVVLLPSVLEEIIFRGIILNELLKDYSAKFAIVFSAFLFGAFHLDFRQGLAAFFLGVILGWLYWRYKSLFLVMFAHAFNNFLGLVGIHMLGNMEDGSLDVATETQPMGVTFFGILLFGIGLFICLNDDSVQRNID